MTNLDLSKAEWRFHDYIVRADGRVFSLLNWRGKLVHEIKPIPDTDGYLRARLTINSRRKPYKIHRLVAEFFLEPRPSPQHELRHLDGDKTNNRADNLAWGTRKDNADDRERHGRTARGIRNGCAKLNKIRVEMIRLLHRFHGVPQKALAQKYGVSRALIWQIIHNKIWR